MTSVGLSPLFRERFDVFARRLELLGARELVLAAVADGQHLGLVTKRSDTRQRRVSAMDDRQRAVLVVRVDRVVTAWVVVLEPVAMPGRRGVHEFANSRPLVKPLVEVAQRFLVGFVLD